MTAIRVMKNTNYTVMCNYHLKDTSISLKAKGLLSMILSLPEGWRMSVEGLVQICLESETAIKSGLSELKKAGYLTVRKIMPGESESGRIEYEYIFREIPDKAEQDGENQGVVSAEQEGENQDLEFQAVENVGQLNKDNKIKIIYNTPYNPPSTSSQGDYSPAEKSAGDPPPAEKPCAENPDVVTAEPERKKKPQKHRYGRYNNVLLTDEEYSTLQAEFPSDYSDRIERLSEYIESKGEKYKSHLATIRNWARRDKEKCGWQSTGQAVKQGGDPGFDFFMQEAMQT